MPLTPIFDVDQLKINETQPLKVSCISNGSRPAAVFYWRIGDQSVTSSSTQKNISDPSTDTFSVNSTLIYSVDRTYNGRQIICGVTHQTLTDVLEISTVLFVYFAPTIIVTNVTYNQSAKTTALTCTPFGNPTTYTFYIWQHKSSNGLLIRELRGGQDGVLTLPSVLEKDRYQDSGEYICSAGNGIAGRDGKIQQTGAGYVTVNAQPVFINNNTITQYGQTEKYVDITYYVYSIPKYSSIRWYKGTEQIVQSAKFLMSDTVAVVNGILHGSPAQLNSYRVTLTIKEIKDTDFNISYTLQLTNSVGHADQTVYLETIAPPIPVDFKLIGSTVSSITLQWDPGDTFHDELTFFIEYRFFEDNMWSLKKIPNSMTSEKQTYYTILGLQDGATYEIRMYSGNAFDNSKYTEVQRIQTIEKNSKSSSNAVAEGVSGGLSAVIIILIIIIFMMRKGFVCERHDEKYKRPKERRPYQISFSKQVNDGIDDETNIPCTTGAAQKNDEASSMTYETLGVKNNPGVYSELSLEVNAKTYETLGAKNLPNTYDILLE